MILGAIFTFFLTGVVHEAFDYLLQNLHSDGKLKAYSTIGLTILCLRLSASLYQDQLSSTQLEYINYFCCLIFYITINVFAKLTGLSQLSNHSRGKIYAIILPVGFLLYIFGMVTIQSTISVLSLIMSCISLLLLIIYEGMLFWMIDLLTVMMFTGIFYFNEYASTRNVYWITFIEIYNISFFAEPMNSYIRGAAVLYFTFSSYTMSIPDLEEQEGFWANLRMGIFFKLCQTILIISIFSSIAGAKSFRDLYWLLKPLLIVSFVDLTRKI